MTEKLHQSLSSIMDGAGDDLELPRLLNTMQASPQINDELSAKWRRYHLAQGVLRSELRGTKHPKAAQFDISAAVMQQIDDENLSCTAANFTQESGHKPASGHKPESGQWWRGAALAASVALLVITGTQIYNINQESEGSAPAFAVQEFVTPMTRPIIETSHVASDCQSPLFSGVAIINLPIEMSQRKPCSNNIQTFSPLLNAQQSKQQGITPVSSR
ncbi:MAG TPA: sigma-E factor negative regulatory protein [Marinospirillum sp.]|uniref:sigma-E factor negative regulatory protein n=1 Tax=Marinospirillum sp. TaxID=2183934 RepID=UPI002B4861A4|nr:sigma-E factor negative regulatory protein [Marinospirillum sp.]HKM14999.1 sigma-E factor negative regulatory protein [Marinospirillum sp.]